MRSQHRGSSYFLRPARQSDLPFVVALHNESLREYLEPLFGWDQNHWKSFISTWFDPQRVKIIQVDEVDSGLLVVEERSDEILFESISITSSLRNLGLGSKIIGDVIERSKVSGFPIHLDVLKTNLPARRLYERLGFVVIGETETDFQLRYLNKK